MTEKEKMLAGMGKTCHNWKQRLNWWILLTVLFCLSANAQTGLKKVYNEDINPIEQIDLAVVKAKSEGKFVVCQDYGGARRLVVTIIGE